MKESGQKTRTFGRKLQVIVIVVPCAVVLTTFCVNWQINSKLTYDRECKRFHSRVEFKARQLYELLEKVAILPRSLATDYRINGQTPREGDLILREKLQLIPECDAILWAFEEDAARDRQAISRIVTKSSSHPLNYDHRQDNRANRWYLDAKKKFDTAKPIVTEPFLHKGGSGALGVIVAQPILDREGEFVGVAGVEIDCEKLGEYLKGVARNPETSMVNDADIIAYLVSPEGFVVARSDGRKLAAEPTRLTASEGAEVIGLAVSPKEGIRKTASFLDENQTRRHLFCHRIANSGWRLAESVPEEKIYSLFYPAMVRLAQIWGTASAVMILVMVVLGSIITHHMVRLIYQVTDAAASLESEGRATADLGTLALRNDEFGQLARGFQSMEDRVRLRTSELARKNRELEQAKEETELAMKQQEIFLNNVAHDLRNPLSIVIGYSQDLFRKAEKKNQTAFIPDLKLINNKGKELLELINDMLNFSKALNSKGVELDLSSFDIEAMIRSRMEGIGMLARMGGNTVEFDPGPSLGTMVADQGKLWRILMNLIGNACKFTKDGSIKVSAKRETFGANDFIIFRVSDTGIGMSGEQMARLFDRFAQVHEASSKMQSGVGLGLSICALYTHAMGGWIDPESDGPGRGTTFIVTLPAVVGTGATQSAPRPSKGARVPRHPSPSEDPAGNEANLVLIIDDDQSVTELLRRNLDEQGYRTRIASSGEEGLRLAKQLLPSAIILDVVMPGIDGWSVLAALKTDDEMADIPIIMASMLDEKDRSLRMGADEYVSKPFGRDHLVELLHKYLGAGPQPRILVVEDDEPTRERLVNALRLEGWLVAEASNAQEALEQLRESKPDLVILDILLPDRNGLEVLSDIRADVTWQSIPVVVLTAADLDAETRRSLRGQVEAVLAKGLLSREDLLREIRILLDPHQGSKRSILMEKSFHG